MTNFDNKITDAYLALANQIKSYNKQTMLLKDKYYKIKNQLSLCSDIKKTNKYISALNKISTLIDDIDKNVKIINTKIKSLKKLNT